MNLSHVQLLPVLKACGIACWFILIFHLERSWQHHHENLPRWQKSIGLWAINNLLSLTIILPISLWASQHPLLIRPDHWLQTALNVVILDLALYGWHRLCHHAPFLWRLHRVHHLDQMLDSTSALRFHGAEILCAALIRVPLIILFGINWTSLILFETLILVASIFHHAAIILPERTEHIMSRIIVTPNWHHQHHHPETRHTNSHYGTLFSFWDRLFKSHSETSWQRTNRYGLEHEKDRGFLDLLRLR